MIRVLLVEDDAMIREMTRIFLESQKRFEVVCSLRRGSTGPRKRPL